MKLDCTNLPRMIDLSCVKTNITMPELVEMVEMAKKYRFICCFAMPCFTPWLAEQLKDEKDILLGGTIGFPSGADLTSTKLAAERELLAMGCDEIDMVINVGALKSGMYDYVKDEIAAVVKTAEGKPVKSILEVAYLTEYEIQKASELAVSAGVTFVKTGTGWAPTPSTVEHIKLIKSVVGDSAYIKAAGGVKDLKTISEMIDAGCSRFGIGIKSVRSILQELESAK
ncbi:MAG: deoxyribose-phosphate aldolase [Clostridia bacterium]|nr:deoxyribose-phosphate aldolase [Clostridia bacterium]